MDSQVTISFGDYSFLWGDQKQKNFPWFPKKEPESEYQSTTLIKPLNTNLTVQSADIILKKKIHRKILSNR